MHYVVAILMAIALVASLQPLKRKPLPQSLRKRVKLMGRKPTICLAVEGILSAQNAITESLWAHNLEVLTLSTFEVKTIMSHKRIPIWMLDLDWNFRLPDLVLYVRVKPIKQGYETTIDLSYINGFPMPRQNVVHYSDLGTNTNAKIATVVTEETIRALVGTFAQEAPSALPRNKDPKFTSVARFRISFSQN